MGGGCFETSLANRFEFFGVVSDTATRSTHGERWTNNRRKTHLFLHCPGFFHRMSDAGTCRAQTDFGHRILELGTIFGFVDGFGCRADQLALVFIQHAVTPKIERAVQCRLATHRGQDCIRAFFIDDAFNHLPGDGLNVSDIGHLGVGHDGGRITVDQNDFVAFLAQGLASLRAGIIELTGLTDDDRTGTNDENAFDIGTLSHFCVSPSSPRSGRTKGRCHADRVMPRDVPESRMQDDQYARILAATRQTERYA